MPCKRTKEKSLSLRFSFFFFVFMRNQTVNFKSLIFYFGNRHRIMKFKQGRITQAQNINFHRGKQEEEFNLRTEEVRVPIRSKGIFQLPIHVLGCFSTANENYPRSTGA